MNPALPSRSLKVLTELAKKQPGKRHTLALVVKRRIDALPETLEEFARQIFVDNKVWVKVIKVIKVVKASRMTPE